MIVRGIGPSKKVQLKDIKLSDARQFKKTKCFNFVAHPQASKKQRQKSTSPSRQTSKNSNFNTMLTNFTKQVKNSYKGKHKAAAKIQPNNFPTPLDFSVTKAVINKSSKMFVHENNPQNKSRSKLVSRRVLNEDQQRQANLHNIANVSNNLFSFVRKGRSLSNSNQKFDATLYLLSNILRIKTDQSQTTSPTKSTPSQKKFTPIGNQSKDKLKSQLIEHLTFLNQHEDQQKNQPEQLTKQQINIQKLSKKYKFKPRSSSNLDKKNVKLTTRTILPLDYQFRSYNCRMINQEYIKRENQFFGPWGQL